MQNRELSPTLVTLLGVNLVFLVLFRILNTSPFLYEIGNMLALRLPNSEQFIPIQYISYMFMHADMGHLLANMISIFLFGPLLERVWGTQRFLLFYLVTGIGGGILYTAVRYYEYHAIFEAIELFLKSPTPDLFDSVCNKYYSFDNSASFNDEINSFYANKDLKNKYIYFVLNMKERIAGQPMVGASGAAFGLLFAFAYLFPNTELNLMFVPISLPAKFLVILYGGYELFFGIYKLKGDKIAHWGHLGGILFAYLMLYIWEKSRKSMF